MSQTPNPQDPYRPDDGTPAPHEPNADAPTGGPQQAPYGDVPSGDVPAPTSDPALHPHDPYAVDPAASQDPAVPQDPFATQDPGAAPDPAFAAQGQGAPQDPSFGAAPGGYAGAGHGGPHAGAAAGAAGYAGAQAGSSDMPPAGLKGVYEGPLSGQPVSGSDSRMWSLFAHLSAIIGYVVGVGFLGWLGPLIIFLVFKDRDRYVRYNAAEALNAAIAVVIASVVLWIIIVILGVVTLGIGFLLSPIAYIPAVVHGIFAIIGAVKSNQGAWWNYPFNLRLFS